MTQREAALFVMEEAEDGIGWIAFWKKGDGWSSMFFYPEYDERDNSLTFDDKDDKEILEKIVAMDPNAIIVNSYYDNLGDVDELTPMKLGRALRRLYEDESGKITNRIIIFKERG